MKILSNNISIVKSLQSRLDNKYGKGILKAAMVLMLFGCMSFFTSCASTGSESRPSPIEGENQRRSNNSSSQSGPATITIEQTGQTAQLGDEIYDTDEPHVIDAYLAKKVEEENKKEGQKYISIRGNDFEPINSGEFGDEVYVIVDTINLVGKTATISILDKEGILVKGKMGRVTFKGSKDGKYSEKIGDDDYALFKINLKPNKEGDENIWKKKCKTKIVLLAIQVDVDDAENIIYCGKNNEQDNKANIWLNKDGSWFKISVSCFCGRDITVAEMTEIITQLRKNINVRQESQYEENGNPKWIDEEGNIYNSNDRGKSPKEGLKRYKLEKSSFDDYGTNIFNLDADEKISFNQADHVKEFTKEINKTFFKYEINTCIRKIHFLAQAWAETQYFLLTYEKNPNNNVSGGDFYRGRGIIHITHDYNYQKYYKYIYTTEVPIGSTELTNFVPKVAKDMQYAVDAGGYFWKYIGARKGNINQFADKDDSETVTKEVNGYKAKDNTKKDRVEYVTLLKTIFEYDRCSNKKI